MKEIIKNYFVTEEGKIYNKNGLLRKTNVQPRQGYEIFAYWLDGKFKSTTVHRLVAKAFIPNPENKPCVNHIDGNKLNNHVNNLEWVTYSENTLHALNTGLKIPEQGEDVHNSSITNEQCREICRLMEQGVRNSDIEKTIDVATTVLKNIRSGKSWIHISKDYELVRKPDTLSDETAHWICKKFSEGWKNKDIILASTNPKVNKSVVTKIRNKKHHRHVSDLYVY